MSQEWELYFWGATGIVSPDIPVLMLSDHSSFLHKYFLWLRGEFSHSLRL